MPLRSPSALANNWPSTMPTSSTVWCWSTSRSPVGLQLQIEAAVLGEQLQHVVEEADAGRDLVAAAAFDLERAARSAFLWCRAGWWRFSCGEHLSQLVDVVEDGDGAFLPGTATTRSS